MYSYSDGAATSREEEKIETQGNWSMTYARSADELPVNREIRSMTFARNFIPQSPLVVKLIFVCDKKRIIVRKVIKIFPISIFITENIVHKIIANFRIDNPFVDISE